MGTEPVVEQVDDPSLDPEGRAEMELWGETTCLNVPIAFRGERLGILMLAWTEAARRFNDQELDFAMGLGELAAIAVRNARLASTQGAS
jgi:GAF domain-containing protein